MARDWRKAVLAALAVAMLAGACAMVGALPSGGAFAQQAEEEEPEQEEVKAADDKAGKKAKGKKQDPAEAQRVIESALKQIQSGRASEAERAVSATLAAGNLPPAIMAKALYVRGVAYRRLGRSALAISDLSGALWLKGGLGGDDREEALKEKAAAYADAGLADPGDSKPAAKSAGGGGNWLSGLFGGLGGSEGASSPPPKKVERVAPPPAPPATPTKGSGLSAWSSQGEVEEVPSKAPPKGKSAPKAPPKATVAPPSAPAKKIDGHYLVQLAAMKTEAEALALAAKAKREYGSLLSTRSQTIDRKAFGNMGTFYRVRFGPFATAQETQAVCAKLQGSGIDCLPIVNQ